MTFDALGSRGFAFTQTDKLLCCKTLANQADTDTCVRVCIDIIYARAMSLAAAPSPYTYGGRIIKERVNVFFLFGAWDLGLTAWDLMFGA